MDHSQKLYTTFVTWKPKPEIVNIIPENIPYNSCVGLHRLHMSLFDLVVIQIEKAVTINCVTSKHSIILTHTP